MQTECGDQPAVRLRDRRLNRCTDSNQCGPGRIEHRVISSITSTIHIASFEQGGEREVTYWIDRAHWGRGIATRALRSLLAELPMRPLHARAAADNAASIRVLTNCGFVVCGADRGFAAARGAEIDELLLRLDS